MNIRAFLIALYICFSCSLSFADEHEKRGPWAGGIELDTQKYLCLAWVDLQGRVRSIGFSSPRPSQCQKDKGMSFPALFVMTMGEDKITYAVALFERKGKFYPIWKAPLFAPHLQAINDIDLMVSSSSHLLDISLYYTVLPGASDVPFQPGPPMQQVFRFDGEQYK